ncbi:MAG: baseplate J/gp47 family protein, partial [Caulobacteraceae bacterium]
MAISTKNFATLVSDMVAAVQGQATALVDFSSGGMIRSLIEAVAGLTLWLESLALQVAALCRASTSTGADLDSFVADYGFSRQGATAAVADVTFSRFTASAQALIPAGAQVGTLDGTQVFSVTASPSNPAWSASQNGYVVPAGTASLSGVPVAAVTAGAAGNVVVGAIGLLMTAIPGVDTVTNPAPASGGADAESDASLRAGFQTFILSLASATLAAIGAA